jgi:hypothetical protein
MKYLFFIFSLFILGCETLPEPPDKGASYRTDYETYTIENTTAKEFCDQMTDNKEIIEGAYRDGDNITKLEKSE